MRRRRQVIIESAGDTNTKHKHDNQVIGGLLGTIYIHISYIYITTAWWNNISILNMYNRFIFYIHNIYTILDVKQNNS